MSAIYSFMTIVNLLDVLLAGGLAYLCWERRHLPGAGPLGATMTAIAWWSFFNVWEMVSIHLPLRLLWAHVEYVGIIATPCCYLFFALEYAGRLKRIPVPLRLALIVPSALFLLMSFTDPWHHLLWRRVTELPGHMLVYRHGPGYVALSIYDYTLFAVAGFLILRLVAGFPTRYWKTGTLLVTGMLMPFATSVLYNFNLVPPGVDLTPLGFAASGVCMYLGVTRSDMLNVLPVARNVLFDRMTEGVLIFNAHKDLADYNQVALDMLGIRPKFGLSLEDLPAPWNTLGRLFEGRNGGRAGLTVEDSSPRWYEIDFSMLQEEPVAQVDGYFFLIRDVTERKLMESHLEALAIHDALTGLYNRYYLNPAVVRDVARCSRQDVPLSLVMFDVDHFKRINDRYGHQTGDMVLRNLGAFLLSNVRKGDFVCRYGGEEFVVVLPGAAAEVAVRRAEEWRRRFAENLPEVNGLCLPITFSGGVSAFPRHGSGPEALIRAADEALYRAKSSGRDRIELAG